MKKTLLLTVLILSLVFSVTAYAAATETQSLEITPDIFWNGGSDITANASNIFPEGTLPTSDTAGYMRPWRALSTALGTAMRFRCAGTGYGTDTITASAVPESDGSSNIVFKITGSQQTILGDSAFTAGSISRHMADFKLSGDIPANGVVGLFALGADVNNIGTASANGTGVFVSNGGVYINDAATSDKLWVVEAGTLSADTWYTVDARVEVIAAGNIVQKVVVKDNAGAVIGESAFVQVSTDEAAMNFVQLYTENLGSGVVMLDNWKTYAASNTRGTLSFVQDPDSATRKVYKFVSTIPLNGDMISTDLVTIEAADPAVDLTGKYTVTYDAVTNEVVITMDESLPFGTTFTAEIDPTAYVESDEGYVAYNYASTSVVNSMTQTFTTATMRDVFVVSVAADGTTTIDNRDIVPHEYLVIAVRFDSTGKFLETAASYGSLSERVSVSEGTSTSIPLPTFTETIDPSDVIKVMIWDNWDNMEAYADVAEL